MKPVLDDTYSLYLNPVHGVQSEFLHVVKSKERIRNIPLGLLPFILGTLILVCATATLSVWDSKLHNEEQSFNLFAVVSMIYLAEILCVHRKFNGVANILESTVLINQKMERKFIHNIFSGKNFLYFYLRRVLTILMLQPGFYMKNKCCQNRFWDSIGSTLHGKNLTLLRIPFIVFVPLIIMTTHLFPFDGLNIFFSTFFHIHLSIGNPIHAVFLLIWLFLMYNFATALLLMIFAALYCGVSVQFWLKFASLTFLSETLCQSNCNIPQFRLRHYQQLRLVATISTSRLRI